MWTNFCWDEGKKNQKNEIQNGAQKMHFWPVFELMSDSITAI